MKNYLLIFCITALLFSAQAQTGPAGVGNVSSNILWLASGNNFYTDAGITNALNGQSVQQWNDISGNNNHAFQLTGANKPLFRANVSNGLSGIQLNGNMFLDGPALGIVGTSSYTYLMVFRDTVTTLGGINDGGGDFILDRTTATNNLVSLKPISGNVYAFQKRNNAGGGLGGPSTTTNINPNNKIIEMRRDYNVNYQIHYNGNLQNTLADSDGPTTPPNPRIGRHATSTNGGLRGYINEFIIFNFALNSAQTIIMNNYLAAKYNIPLTTNDIYTRDNPANGNFDFEVAGIGRVNATNIHNDAQGTSIVRINNPTNLNNNEFLIWGHNNALQQATNTTDIPAGVQARFERVWRVNEVNSTGTAVDVGAIDMSWDLSALGAVTASDLRLLVDANNNGIFSDDTPIAGAISLGGGIYQFQGVTAITNNRRFTIATANIIVTPLPIVLVNFYARQKGNAVELEWTTATEINNDFFTIERSLDAENFEVVAQVKGAGNSNAFITYDTLDKTPYTGTSFYRLKQTDFDGQFEYFNIVPVRFEKDVSLEFTLFPNPIRADENLGISANFLAKEEILIVIRDMQGKEFYSKVHIKQTNNELIAVPIDKSIPSGIYVVIATSENSIYSKKLVIE